MVAACYGARMIAASTHSAHGVPGGLDGSGCRAPEVAPQELTEREGDDRRSLSAEDPRRQADDFESRCLGARRLARAEPALGSDDGEHRGASLVSPRQSV